MWYNETTDKEGGMGMTIRKRLARSNIAMLVIPLLTVAVLALLGLGAALVVGLTMLRGSAGLLTVDMAQLRLTDAAYLFLSGAWLSRPWCCRGSPAPPFC